MFNIKSSTNYNEMLGGLNKATFFTTLFFFVALRYFNFIPLIEVDKTLIPPLKEYQEIIAWGLSFGVIPLIAALGAYFLSHSFEIHNKIAKTIFIRYLWDKYFIIKPMLERVSSEIKLKDVNIKKAMNELYYPNVKNIDQHYVHLFWRYALPFWILFEHSFFVVISILGLLYIYPEHSYLSLIKYNLIIIFITVLQLLFVTVQKSKDQAKQINIDKINDYFN
ncbi:hypothetical protein [Endozoicomonas ascidiicola]|uniref:hypothetical protein n=1 Tax=Endozoicomonas ascidiicola TaxID=1698521 RepID=UPI000835478B|nr:hypothetical protein [Endozoicomonas ascidiicola]